MHRKPKKKRKIRIYDAGFSTDCITGSDPPMGYTFDTKVKIPATANTTTNANPATGTITVAADADLLVVAMIYGGNAARTGGAPTANGINLTQADAARTVTEAVAELWYLTTPTPGDNVIVVPNTPTAKNLDIFVASFKAQSGYNSVFSSASGSATTVANPNITLRVPDTQSVVVSVVGHGANAWGPTSQSGTVIYNEDPSTWGGGAQFILNPPIGAVISAWTQASDDYGLVAAAFTEQLSSVTGSASISDIGHGADSILVSKDRRIYQTFAYIEYLSNQRRIYQDFAYVEYLYNERRAHQTFAYIEYLDIERVVPTSDLDNPSGWQSESGTSILYPSIDELVDPNDNDYVWFDGAQIGDYFDVKLASPEYLLDGGDVRISWRAFNRNPGVNTTVRVDLREGDTVRASDERTLSDTPTTYEYTLTSAEVNSIANIDILSLRFAVTGVS